MNKAVLLALLVVIVGALNDLIYHKNGIYVQKNGVWRFYFLASVFSALYCLAYIIVFGGGLHFYLREMACGIAIGIVSFATYLLFLMSFDGVNTSVTIVIFRMNLVPGIILAMIFIGESITIIRVAGIIMCITGMLLFAYQRSDSRLTKKHLFISICACLMCGVLNVANKATALSGADVFHIMFYRFVTVSLIVGLLLLSGITKWERGGGIGYPMISGMLLMLSVLFIMEALKTGDVSVVIPISQMSFVITAIVSWIVYKEKLRGMKLLGITCCVLSVVFIR